MTGHAIRNGLPKPRISVVINTLNEEKNLPYALRSVRSWVDEIIVVDMYSEDRTVEIAREYGSKVYFHPRVTVFDSARTFALEQATGDWILMLDADEVIPHALSVKLLDCTQQNRADVIAIPMVNYMLGAPMKHTRLEPWTNRHLRFFKPGALRLTEAVHKFKHPAADARVEYLPYVPGEAMVHFANLDCAHILDKINRYTTIEAEQSPSKGKRPSVLRAIVRASGRFVRLYLTGKGYRDGWRGFQVSALSSLYCLFTFCKLCELHENGPREAVRGVYQREAEKILMEYDAALRTSTHGH